jgi:hypothetical protein
MIRAKEEEKRNKETELVNLRKRLDDLTNQHDDLSYQEKRGASETGDKQAQLKDFSEKINEYRKSISIL